MIKKDKMVVEKDSVTEMNKMIELTIEHNIEYGGTLCKDKNNIMYLENTCAGEKYCFRPKSYKCSKDKNETGFFHTHPGIDIITSSVVELPQKKDDVLCTGQKSKDGNRILCIKLKKDQIDNDTSRQIEAWNIHDITHTIGFKYFGMGSEKYKKKIDNHIKKYYDETDIK